MSTDPVRAALSTPYVQTLLKIKAHQLSRRREFRRDDPDDIQQDLIAQILMQADNFDPARGCANTFITRVVETAIAMMIRSRKRQKRAAGHRAMSLESTVFKGDGRETSMAEVVSEDDLQRRLGGAAISDQDRSDIRSDLADAIKRLPPEQRRILLHLIDSTQRAAVHELGTSRRQICNATEEARRLLPGWKKTDPPGHTGAPTA